MSTVHTRPTVSSQGAGAPGKPRMVFFRLTRTDLPTFITGHFDDHVRCLAQFFDVVVVSENADYDEVVDRVQPEIALFESGVYARRGRAIAHTDRHPMIPKVGLLNADAYCLTRSVFLADMDDWGVETFFTIAVSATGYSPDIADRTFSWPNFADRRTFHSYPEGKAQSLLLTGSRATNYPWRVQVDRLLSERFPARAMPHAGWFDRFAAAGMPAGEEYARSLSSALIVPTCGTIARELVRKHFEIPAAGALLLTERTDALAAAGFVDMDTCVFADPGDVVDKVEHLLDNPDVLAQVAAAGQRLAHERHSIEHRDQLRQWFELERSRRPDQRIVQRELFAPLTLEPRDAGRRPVGAVAAAGVDRRLLAEGRALLADGRPVQSAERFAQVLNLHYEPEAALGLARSWMAEGRAADARRILAYSTMVVTRVHGASHPDPVELAWLVRATIADGEPGQALDVARRHRLLRHPELDRMRWVAGQLTGTDIGYADRPQHLTLHPGDAGPWPQWRAQLEAQVAAAGQAALAARIGRLEPPRIAPGAPTRPLGALGTVRACARQATRLAARVGGRLQREWVRVRGTASGPERTSVFQLFGGEPVDAVVAVLVDDAVMAHLESLVVDDVGEVGLVRLGRGRPVADGTGFRPRGLRSAVTDALLGEIPRWGRTVVVASASGAARLSCESLAGTTMLVILEPAVSDTAIEAALAGAPGWRQTDAELRSRVELALGGTRTRVWTRVAQAPEAGGT